MYVAFNTSSTKGVSNTGSCSALANYLEKEGEKQFFNHTNKNISKDDVVNTIDSIKRKGMKKEEWKFIEIEYNPSEKELQSLIKDKLGKEVKDIKELSKSEIELLKDELINFVREAQNLQAINYNRDGVNSGSDLVYFGRVETIRKYKGTDEEVRKGLKKQGEEKDGLNMHVHIIQSRKTKDNIKISPLTNYRKKSGNNKIKQGFDRVNFISSLESKFDIMFNHERNIKDTLKYRANKKNGSNHNIGGNLKQQLSRYQIKNFGNFIDILNAKDISWKSDNKNFYIKEGNVDITFSRDQIKKLFVKDFDEKQVNELKNKIEEVSKTKTNFIDLKIELDKKNINLLLKFNKENEPYGYVAVDNNTGIVLSGSKLYSLTYMKRDFEFNINNGVNSSKEIDDIINRFTVSNNYQKRILNDYFLKKYNYNAWNKIKVDKDNSKFKFIKNIDLGKSKGTINNVDDILYKVNEQTGEVYANDVKREKEIDLIRDKLKNHTVSNYFEKNILLQYYKDKYYYNAFNDIKIDANKETTISEIKDDIDIENYDRVTYKDKLGIENNFLIDKETLSVYLDKENKALKEIKELAEKYSYSNEEEKKIILDFFKEKYNYNAEDDVKFSLNSKIQNIDNNFDFKNKNNHTGEDGKKYFFDSEGNIFTGKFSKYQNNLNFSNTLAGSFLSVARGYANSYAQDKSDDNNSATKKKKKKKNQQNI